MVKKQTHISKASQIAFELEQKIATNIRESAAYEGLTSSDQIRKIVGLSYKPPKRPRLTISLTEEDYQELSKKYKIKAENKIEIKKMIIKDLIDFFEKN